MNVKPITINKDGLIERTDLDCNEMIYYKKGIPKARYPDRVLDINNGITLCNECHYKTIGNEDDHINLFVVSLRNQLCGKDQ